MGEGLGPNRTILETRREAGFLGRAEHISPEIPAPLETWRQDGFLPGNGDSRCDPC